MVSEIFKKYGIDHLYHMTHIDNLDSIVRLGLLSHNEAHRLKLIRLDISDPNVQDIRARVKDKHYQRPLHEYVPLYFSPSNPMLYKRREIQEDIVILGLDPQILFEPRVLITNGNAAAEKTLFYASPEHLSELQWDIIRAKSWNDKEDGRRIKCAEVLIPNKITPDKIQRIFCYSDKHRETIIAAKQGTLIKGLEKKDLYFEPRL